MALSAFADKAHPPRDDEVAGVLAGAAPLWNDLRARIAGRFAPLSANWGFSGAKYGWGLRLVQGKRTVLHMTPRDGHFLASCALGEKAARAAHAEGLPAPMLALLDAAPRYAEGRGVRIEVRIARDVADVERLAVVKMAN
jgi:hypothetical protein